MTDVRHHEGRAGLGGAAGGEPGQDLDTLLASWGSAQDGPYGPTRDGGRSPGGRPAGGRHATVERSDPLGIERASTSPSSAPPAAPPPDSGANPGSRRPDAGGGSADPFGSWPPGPATRSGDLDARPYRIRPADHAPADDDRDGRPGRIRPTPATADLGAAGSVRSVPPGAAVREWTGAAGPDAPPAPPLSTRAVTPPIFADADAYARWLNAGAPTGPPTGPPTGVAVLDRPVATGPDPLTRDAYRGDIGDIEEPGEWLPDEIRSPRRRHRAARPARPRWLQILGWVGAFVGVLVVAGGGYGLYQYQKLSGNIRRVDALALGDMAIRDAAKQLDAENYLLIGSDTRAGANGRYEANAGQVIGERSDTTILAHLSPDRQKALLVSFPRDSWVRLPACTDRAGRLVPEQDGQFNEAFSHGGPACTVLAVQKLTGIKINHYVQVDFTGFKTMVDAVGGVPICTTKPLRDTESGLRLSAGTRLLKGEQALAYVRARYGIGDGSDLGRIQRQQRFLGAMVRSATSTKLLVNPVALTRFLDAATKSLTLDRQTSFGDLKTLADQLRDLDPKRVTFLTAPIADPTYNPPGFPPPPPGQAGSRVLLDDVAGRKLWDSIINDHPAAPTAPAGTAASKPNVLTVAPGSVTVRVLNGVGIDGLARKVGGELASAGFRTADASNGPRTTVTTIRYGPGQEAAARTLGAAVPGALLQPDAGATLDLMVGDNYSGVVTVDVGDPATAKTAAPPRKASPSKPAAPAVTAAEASCS